MAFSALASQPSRCVGPHIMGTYSRLLGAAPSATWPQLYDQEHLLPDARRGSKKLALVVGQATTVAGGRGDGRSRGGWGRCSRGRGPAAVGPQLSAWAPLRRHGEWAAAGGGAAVVLLEMDELELDEDVDEEVELEELELADVCWAWTKAFDGVGSPSQ